MEYIKLKMQKVSSEIEILELKKKVLDSNWPISLSFSLIPHYSGIFRIWTSSLHALLKNTVYVNFKRVWFEMYLEHVN